ncbi:mucin-2 [Drosophila tropicalis]|uniref:mucin-2 n=1 Tax=Drosophila tropicalis TaxID=46794 RepID=UPI0035AC1F6B
MDTVYGTKKYFQSLSGVTDIYRTQTCRQMSADYTYQNTLGRRSQLGAYYHMNKQPTHTNDHSLNGQYGYNTWGIWRDGRNIAPSAFSTKTHTQCQKNRSFSIILTTAAFIVLLAVISIAGLAFYFSSIKATLEDPILGFNGSFRISKGDLYSTGLKYNHTTTYKQKIDFYKRFVERALADNGLQSLKTDVWGFGDGPLIKVFFRVFLDVRKLPENILSVEEYIKDSLFLETSAGKSLYRSLRLDTESVEIKRIMDEQIVQSAILREPQAVPTSQTQLEKHLMKKGSAGHTIESKPNLGVSTPKPRHPNTPLGPHSPYEEPDIDVENAPVIQGSFEGSFEITKTDADIARKKAAPTKVYQSSSLPPKTIAVTPYSLRVNPKKPSVEKLTTVLSQPPVHKGPFSTAKPTTQLPTTIKTTKATTTKAPSIQSPSTIPTTTTTTVRTTSATSTTTAAPITSTINAFIFSSLTQSIPTSTVVVPKLDANLFTTFPILDTQPWRPMHREVPELLPGPPPAFPTKTLPSVDGVPSTSTIPHMPQKRIDELELPFIGDNPIPPVAAMPPVNKDSYLGLRHTALRKPAVKFEKTSDGQEKDHDLLFYHNFANPIFMPGTENFERLGGALVEPHPLPVPLLDDVIIPPFKPIIPTLASGGEPSFDIDGSNEKFEHLGGGVIAKKQEKDEISSKQESKPDKNTTVQIAPSTISDFTTPNTIETRTTKPAILSEKTTDNSALADTIGEFFMELLNLPKEESTTTSPISRLDTHKSHTELEKDKEELPEPLSHNLTLSKPNFMNLKEIILQRNTPSTIFSNHTSIFTTSTPSTTTTAKESKIKVNTRVGIQTRPSSDRPTILDDSVLFPSHSKWEFVNSSANQNFEYNGNMKRVFNKTLQAWVSMSEDIDKIENFTLNDIKTRINNASNIQDISLIFDNLASKMGITPSVPTKVPPFSQNKLRHPQKNEKKSTPTNITPTEPTMQDLSIREHVTLPPQSRQPFIKPMSSFINDGSSEVPGAAIPIVGEAEVELVDPLKYEEMLQISQLVESSSTENSAHRLVTLLPVRSNSGIRTYNNYKPSTEDSMSENQSELPPFLSKTMTNLRRKGDVSQSRKFAQPPV